MSMGFIVAIVFAVILLSLAITWIQGLFVQIRELTYETTDIAKENLLDNIAKTGKNVGLAAPAVSEWRRGETGSYAIGIRNDQTDKENTYYANVYLDSAGGGLTFSSVLADEVNQWLTEIPPRFIPAGESDTVDIVIKPFADAQLGIYTFTVAVCKEELGGHRGDCHSISISNPDFVDRSPNLYGTATFNLEIMG